MHWKQVIDPIDNLALSASVAVLPILFIFWALIINKMKGYKASLLATGITLLISIICYGMPVELAFLSLAHGALYGLFPISWIVITAVFLFNLTLKSGQFEIIKQSLASITSDRRLQALLIAFSFGSFLEGTAGFGAPVAITAAMLVGLGFNPLYAAGICLVANTAPVAFGAIGIPITVASQVSGIPEMAISQMVGRTLPLLSIVLPFYLVALMAGMKKTNEILPAILISGISFATLQWFSSNYLGPALPDVIAGIGSIVSLIVFLKFWKPKNIWRFPDEAEPKLFFETNNSFGQILRAWSPFILLTVIIIAWGLRPIKETLNALGHIQFTIPALHQAIEDNNESLISHIFKLNYLSASGTAILISGIISIPLIGMKFSGGFKVFGSTLQQLKYPIITIASVLAFAYLMNASGITVTLAAVLANTGFLFPFFAPVLGWLGVFITGSDTSANALFGKLQYETARSIGVDPVVTLGANVSGGVVAKMISPQSIAVAAAAGNLVGKESDLFRFAVKHSFIMLTFICILVYSQAYLFQWLVPAYEMLETPKVLSMPEAPYSFTGLFLLSAVVLAICALITILARKKIEKNKQPLTTD